MKIFQTQNTQGVRDGGEREREKGRERDSESL